MYTIQEIIVSAGLIKGRSLVASLLIVVPCQGGVILISSVSRRFI
jgi:hypothetical protein